MDATSVLERDAGERRAADGRWKRATNVATLTDSIQNQRATLV